jgi:tetratricopeptide (TPR) repeat protein
MGETLVKHLSFPAVTRPPSEVLAGVRVQPTVIDDLRPLTDSLEWRLAAAYWNRAGVEAFIAGDVPYVVNNSGRLSENAAVLLYASLCDAPVARGPIAVLELGAGTGLFARYFLDAFRSICEHDHRDFYQRLTFVVTDQSAETVRAWAERALFASHEGRVLTAVADALYPEELWAGMGESRLPSPRAIFCNYVLDVLPSSIVRRGPNGPVEELHVGVHLDPASEVLRQYTPLTLDEIRATLAEPGGARWSELESIWPALELETRYLPANAALAALCAELDVSGRAVVNHGAFACLEHGLSLIDSRGFILINDYGKSSLASEPDASPLSVQRFGHSVAVGIDFRLLEIKLRRSDVACAAPPGDGERAVHSRLVAKAPVARVLETFANRFSLEAERYHQEPLDEARADAAAGRRQEALTAFRVALERGRGDWQVMGEAAEYVGLELRDYAAGAELARAALARNPWYSPWLWNVLGDCLFCDRQLDAAHDAYLAAARIAADDPRTNLNLAYTLFERGEHAQALQRVARGLARDVRGVYRTRLLDKQTQILTALAVRAASDEERALKRYVRFA